MKILTFAASNSKNSINQQLVSYAANMVNADIDIIDINDYEMPIYSIDREQKSGIPALAHEFFNKISEADAVLISFAEHNGSYTAAYKNIFDWTSRINMKVYQEKPTVLLATSPGPGGAQSVLAAAVNSAPFFGMDVKGSLSVPSFFDNFDTENGQVSNLEINNQLETILSSLIK